VVEPGQTTDWLDDAVQAPQGVVGLIIEQVRENAVNGLLDGGERERLIRAAMSLGVSRFDAHLILAAAMNRVGVAETTEDPRKTNRQTTNRRSGDRRSERKPWTVWQLVAASLVVEVAAVVMLFTWWGWG
jgi:hypothetical protein